MIPEKEREALMRLTMCAREECIMCKYHKECDFDFQYETATRCMNILAEALRKTGPNCSEKPNNSTISKMEQVEITVDDFNEEVEFCEDCRWFNPKRSLGCDLDDDECHYEPKDEPQTETEIAKAIVHKMIDDAVIAEDAYPDLRQKMHDAVDEYEPQTDCSWK